MSRHRFSRWALVTSLLALGLAGRAFAQSQTGDLFGVVTDDTKKPLPGVTITLQGIGAAQVQTTDEGGKFHFVNLYPGDYRLKAELDGFSPVEYPQVGVRLGGKGTVEITMSSAVKEAITVTGEAPLLDTRKTDQGAHLAATDLNRVPTARDPWSLLSQAPGVLIDRVNVGGNESGQQSNFIGTGASGTDNAFSVDGVVVTDMNAVGASASYFDFGAFEEVQFTTSSTDVTVATSGVTINQITKRGTNQWRGSARYLDTDGSYQAKPAVVNEQPFNKIDSVKEQGIDIGGPLVKDHLWVWGAYGENDIRNLIPAGDGTYQTDRTKLHDANFKMNFQLGAQDSGVLHFWNNDKLKFGRGAGPDTAPGPTHDQTTPAKFYKIENTYIFNPNFVATVLGSHNPGGFTLTPEGGLDAFILVRDANGISQGTGYDFKQKAKIDQYRADASYFMNVGKASHELKFGAGYRAQTNTSGTVWPHGIEVYDPAYIGIDDTTAYAVFPRDRAVSYKTEYKTGWVQDTIAADRWTINAGLRYDGQKGVNLPSVSQANPLNDAIGGILPEINFKGNSANGLSWNTISPRLGVTYAAGDKRDTILRGSFSRYAEQLGQGYVGRANPVGYSYAYFYFQDLNHNDRLDPAEYPTLYAYGVSNINLSDPASTTPGNINSTHLSPTLTDEVTLGLDHGFGTNLSASVLLIYRKIHNIEESRMLVTDESGTTRSVNLADWVPDGTVSATLGNGQTVSKPVFTLRDGVSPTGGFELINGDRSETYKGITVGLTRRLANHWMARGSFNWNDWKWDIGSEFKQHDDPTDTINPTDGNDVYYEGSGGSGNKGNVFLGSRWSFSGYAMYEVAPDRPWGFNIAGSVNGREGFVSPPFVRNNGPGGRRLVQMAPIGEFRNDNIYTLDGRLEKEFKIGDMGINVGLDGFNLLNKHYVIQQVLRQNQTTSNETFETLSPRVLRLGVTLHWR